MSIKENKRYSKDNVIKDSFSFQDKKWATYHTIVTKSNYLRKYNGLQDVQL
jgi:hypothetical protein